MIPLWTTVKAWVLSDDWGCALDSLGLPWVAHRVWAIPTWVSKIGLSCRSIRISMKKIDSKNRLDYLTINGFAQFFNFARAPYDENLSGINILLSRITIAIRTVFINCYASWIVTTVFKTAKSVDKNITNLFPWNRSFVIQIGKDSFNMTLKTVKILRNKCLIHNITKESDEQLFDVNLINRKIWNITFRKRGFIKKENWTKEYNKKHQININENINVQ